MTREDGLITPGGLDNLVGIDEDSFRREYWGKRHAFFRRPKRDPARSLIEISDLDSILSSPATRPPYVRVFKDGSLIDTDRYTFTARVARQDVTGLLDRDQLLELFDNGATVVIDSINHWIPNLQEICESLEYQLGGSARATAFLSPPGQAGLNFHADSYEIFVEQIKGAKEWSLYPALDPVPRSGAVLRVEDFKELEPDVIVLHPGDILYLPWGTPHIVRPLDSVSVHVSIALAYPTWASVLGNLAEHLLQDTAFNGPVLVDRSNPAKLAAQLAVQIGSLADQLTAAETEAVAKSLANTATPKRRRSAQDSFTDRLAST